MEDTERRIGRWISILYRYGQSYVSKKLEPLNIGKGQYVLLLTLYRNGGISQEELADHLKIDKGSIAKSVKKLEDEGYVERSVDTDDKRTYKVFLTPKGLDSIPAVISAIESWEERVTAGLSDNEKETIEQTLHKMAKNACSMRTQCEE